MSMIEDAVRALGGVWPSTGKGETHLYQLSNGNYVAGLPNSPLEFICTRCDFYACTRRLRNEPPWRYAPAWAVAKAQDADGWWYWYSTDQVEAFKHSWEDDKGGNLRRAGKGEVIGDWKRTMELRPEEKKVGSKDDWHEKGEFPPVGTECEVFYDQDWMRTKVVGRDDNMIIFIDPWGDELPYKRMVFNSDYFRPLQTQRDVWIVEAQKAIKCNRAKNRIILARLYDAGLTKMPRGK